MIKKCFVCGKNFEAYDKANLRSWKHKKPKRRSNCITCSSKCSKRREYFKWKKNQIKREYDKRQKIIKKFYIKKRRRNEN